jgi:DNA-binding transcriptional MerR regulator
MTSTILRTSDIAKELGIHTNTLRNYERWGYLPAIPRGKNGYRHYSTLHQEQARLVCLALQWPYLGDRALLVALVKSAAHNEFGLALELAYDYLARIRIARTATEVALEFLEQWAAGQLIDTSTQKLTISQTAQYLNITVDTLRNWERNGLIEIPRHPVNQYRLYSAAHFARLRVIRQLVQTGYSLMAISRMVQQVDAGKTDNLRAALELPPQDSANEAIDVMSDHWLSSLEELEQRAQAIIGQLSHMITLAQIP